MTDLVFRGLPATTQPVALVFGASDVAPITDATVSLVAALPPLGGLLPSVVGVQVAATGVFPGLGGHVTLQYSSSTQRPTVSRVVAEFDEGRDHLAGVQVSASVSARLEPGWQGDFAQAQHHGQQIGAAFTQSASVQTARPVVFQEAAATEVQAQAQVQQAQPVQVRHAFGFEEAARSGYNARVGFDEGERGRRRWLEGRFQEAGANTLAHHSRGAYARPASRAYRRRFQEGRKIPAGVYVRPTTPVQPARTISTALLFQCQPLAYPGYPVGLIFGAKPCYPDPVDTATFYILPARVYMTTHTVYAQRLPDLAEVPIFEATVSADAGSYCWTLSASGPASLFAQLAPVGGLPVQLRITLDGIPFVFAVDSLSRSTGFGKSGVSISGRSVTALIGAPYLRATTRDNAGSGRLAQQLAGDALQFTGVDLDWGLTDWLVSAGAWSHQGTPLDAVQAIAQAAGGYLQSHPSAATLLTRHPYSQRTGDNPGAPWGWMTGPADVELAPDAIITDGTERRDGPDINAVYVSGTTQGVLGLVKRTGSAADKLAAMVADPLITHVDAARQRGLAILGAAGVKYNVRLELPVLTGLNQPGVLDVGQLVQVNAAQPWRGRVRAVSVNAKRPSLRQTITLERHLEVV